MFECGNAPAVALLDGAGDDVVVEAGARTRSMVLAGFAVSCGARTFDAEPLGTDTGTELDCDTPGASWGSPVAVENDEGWVAAGWFKLGLGSDGTVTGAWRQDRDTEFDSLSVRMSQNVAGAWQSPIWLQTNYDEVSGWWPLVAAGADKDAFVVWLQKDEFGDASIWAARVDENGPSVAQLQVLDHPQTSPGVAMNEAGDVIVAWTQVATISARLWDAASATWTDEAVLQAGDDSIANANANLEAVIDTDGNATVAWNQPNSGDNLFAARFDATTRTWGAPVLVHDGETAQTVAVTDQLGNVTLTWLEWTGVKSAIRATRFEVASNTWTSPTHVLGEGHYPRIAVTSTGVVIVAWLDEPRILAAVHHPEDGWSETFTVYESEGVPYFTTTPVGIDDRGCATVMWMDDPWPAEGEEGWHVSTIRVDVQSKTVGNRVVIGRNRGGALSASLVVDGDGTATAAWVDFTHGAPNAISARFE